jgi:hypothetical protein
MRKKITAFQDKEKENNGEETGTAVGTTSSLSLQRPPPQRHGLARTMYPSSIPFFELVKIPANARLLYRVFAKDIFDSSDLAVPTTFRHVDTYIAKGSHG